MACGMTFRIEIIFSPVLASQMTQRTAENLFAHLAVQFLRAPPPVPVCPTIFPQESTYLEQVF